MQQQLWAVLDNKTDAVVTDVVGLPAVATSRNEIRNIRREYIPSDLNTRIGRIRVKADRKHYR